MIQIKKGGKVRGVTAGAFKSIYQPLGWELVDDNALAPQEDDKTPPAGSENASDTAGVTQNENANQDETGSAGDDTDDEDMEDVEHSGSDDGIEDLLETPVNEMSNKELAKAARYLEVPMADEAGNKRKVSAVRKDVAKKIAERK